MAPDGDDGAPTPESGRRSGTSSGASRFSRWRHRGGGAAEVEELDSKAAEDFIRRSAGLDRTSAPSPASLPSEPAESRTEANDEDPFPLVETAETRAARLRLEDEAARKVIADALQVGLADPEPPAPRRGFLKRAPGGQERADAAPEPPDVPDATDARSDDDVARAELRALAEAERSRREAAERRAEELAERVAVAEAERVAAEQRMRELADAAKTSAAEHAAYVEQTLAEADERAADLARQLAELRSARPAAPEPPATDPLTAPWVDPLAGSEPEPQPEPPADVTPEPAVAAVAEPSAPQSYHVRRGGGAVAVAVSAAALLGLAGIGLLVSRDALVNPGGIVLCVVTAALLLLALRRTSATREVSVEGGTMKLMFGDRHHTFYLASPSTRLEMVGRPGDRDWRLMVLRRGMSPVIVDAKAVDPVAFTDVVRQWRPEL